MKTTRQSVGLIVSMVFLGVTSSVASGQNPLPCTHPAPHECIPFNAAYDEDMDGTCSEDEINGRDDDGDGVIDEDPFPPMCDWEACIGTDCSSYTLKYFRSADLLTQNNNITRAVIAVHGRRNHRSSVDDRPIDYYFHIRNAASDLNLLNSTLIIAPFFDEPKKCPVDANNACIQGAADVDNPRCGPSGDRLCWDVDVGDYPAGGNASNDDHVWAASFSLLDDMINTLAHLKATGIFPNLDTIVVTGQSAGGQFTLRYAMTGSAEPAGITMRYVACNPGGVTYLNALRPTPASKEAFPNLGYEWDCDADGTNEPYEPPGTSGMLANPDDWKNHPPYIYDIPQSDWAGSYWGDCVTDGRYEEWPWGIADVESANDYLATNVGTPDEARARYLRRNVVILSSIDDNLYVAPGNCGAPETSSEWNCMHALQGHARAERNALFFQYDCLGFGCLNHAFETVCLDNNNDGSCDFFDVCRDNDGDGICDNLGFAYTTIPCNDNNVNGICEIRLGHGGGIYGTVVARQAVFFGLQSMPLKTEWGKTLGGLNADRALAVEKTPEDGYIVMGQTDSYGAGGRDLWMVKLDENGTVLWQKVYGGEGDDTPAAMTVMAEGGYLVVGSTDSQTNGESDAWVIQIDKDGALQWSNSYGDDYTDGAFAVAPTADGNYVIAGKTRIEPEDPNDPIYSDGWLMKLSPNGYIYWRKIFDGTIMDSLSSVQQAWDGGYILAGATQVRNGDFWVLKLDSDGNVQEEKIYGMNEYGHPEGNENGEISPHIKLAHDGGYILAGTSAMWFGKYTFWVLKLAGDFSITWQKLFLAPGDCDLTSVQPTTDGGYILSGNAGTFDILSNAAVDGWVMKLDPDGNQQWQHRYGAMKGDSIFSVEQARDGGYICAGVTDSLSFSDEDLWVLKLDENGEIPDCPAIQAGILVEETDLSEVPENFSSSVSESVPLSITWTALVTVTDPPPVQVFEGDGCSLQVADFIDTLQTGQTICYDASGTTMSCAGTGQDGDVLAGAAWPIPRFQDNGDGTMLDRLTGLVWLKDANYAQTVGYDTDGLMEWEETLDFVAAMNAGGAFSNAGYNDWRAPNVNEIETLIHSGVVNPVTWLTEQGFDHVQTDYWSSTTHYYVTSTDYAWYAQLANARLYNRRKYFTFAAWPVRAGQSSYPGPNYPDPNYPANVGTTGLTTSYYPGDDGAIQAGVSWPDPRFTDNGDGTVTDNLTGLMWLKDSNCFGNKNWVNALATVADFNTANRVSYACPEYTAEYTDWHLPNRKELLSLFDRSKRFIAGNPALPSGHPFQVLCDGSDCSYPYWSSTSTLPGYQGTQRAWQFTMYGTMQPYSKSYGSRVWPVRGGVKCYGDCDGDGDVDGSDLAAFLLDFTANNPEGVCNADFNRDGQVDEQDISWFAGSLGRTNCSGQ